MSSPQPARVQVRGPAGIIAVVPHLLGFHPRSSFVIVAMTGPHGRVTTAFRFDLPDPPGTQPAAVIADHAVTVLRRMRTTAVIGIGYGPGTLVTPVADAVRVVLPREGVRVHDVLRVDEGRYWSYLCHDPVCCPPDGVPVSSTHPASIALAEAGLPAADSRAARAATIAPVTGPEAVAMLDFTAAAEGQAAATLATAGPEALDSAALAAVQAAIECYRGGGVITDPNQFAVLALGLTRMRVRDDAWARMDPDYREAHLRLWTDLTRRAQPGYVAAPASLLAFVAWQTGDGALANLALDRALTTTPATRWRGCCETPWTRPCRRQPRGSR